PYKKQFSIMHVESDGIKFDGEFQLDFHTNLNNEFLEWRYKSEDYQKVIFENDHTHFLVYKISNFKTIRMIVIYEICGKEENFSVMLHSLAAHLKIYIIYYINKKQLKKLNLLKTFHREKPVIVYKDDNLSIN